jgi:hypothetical protein
VHPAAKRQEVRELVEDGLNDCAIARATGLPRSTVRDMRHAARAPVRAPCVRCGRPSRPLGFDAGTYAELLGFYLGDGHIAAAGRTHRLRISLDASHARIVDDVVALLRASFPRNRVGLVRQDDGATAVPYVYSSHLPCLFPQAAPGLKHDRRIILEPWQTKAVEAAPWAFLRGLTHSDGCFFINRTGPYRYLSVAFSNRSRDIIDLFVWACGLVGVACRPNGENVRIYRRAAVADFAAFVGSKS